MLSLHLSQHLLVFPLLRFLLAIVAILLLLILLNGPLKELSLLCQQRELFVLLTLTLYQFPLQFLDHQVLRIDFRSAFLEFARVLPFLEFGLLLPVFFLGYFFSLQ